LSIADDFPKTAANNLKKTDDYGIVTTKLLNTDQTLNFFVIDHAAPVASSFLPADNAPNVINLTSPLEINIANYDGAGLNLPETMKAGVGNVNIYRANGTVFDVVAASACDFTTVGKIKVPHLALEAYTSYYVTYASGVFKDLKDNDLAGVSNSTDWNFATHDDRAPYPLVLDPIAGGTDVPVFANLKIQFSENVAINNVAAKISIYNRTNNATDDGNWVEDIVVNSARVVFSGSDVANGKTSDIVTIDPSNFTTTGVYYVRIDANAFKDLDNITWMKSSSATSATGFDSYNDWFFTNSNNTVPAPNAWNPAISSVVPVSQSVFTLGFNRSIAKGITGKKIRIYEYVLNPTTNDRNSYLYDEIDITAATIVNGNTLSFSFTKPLLENKSWYYITIDNGAVTNDAASKDAWLGYADPNSWKFSTDDNTDPKVSLITPLAGATDLTNNVNFELTFDENIVKNLGSFKLYKKDGDVLKYTINIADATLTNNNKLSFAINGLEDRTAYYLLIDAGIVKDDAFVANAYAGVSNKSTYEFTVKDNNAPTLAVTPGAGAIATNIFTVDLTFSEDVVAAGVISGITVDNGAKVTVTGTGASYNAAIIAQSNTTVTLTVPATIKDLADFNFAGATYIYTVTGDKLAPTATLTPADGTGTTPETGVVRNPELKMTFNEAVVVGTAGAKVKVYKQDVSASNTKVYETAITASMISTDGLTLTLPAIDPLTDNTDYVVLVDAGLVKSSFGVNYAGISDPTTWNFKTGDNTPPVLTITNSQTPNELNAKNDILVTLQFNEAVYGVAGAITVTGNSIAPVITGVDGGMNYTVAINAADLATVGFTVGTGVTDKYGRNHLAAAQTVNFTVGDNTKPNATVTGSVNKNTVTATITFDENVTVPEGAITASNITGTVAVTKVGNVYTATMTAADAASVSVSIAGTVFDGNNNFFVAKTFGPYVVGDNTAPEVVATPATGAVNKTNNFTVALAFNEAVNVPTGAISVSSNATAIVTPPTSGNTYSVAINAADGAVVTLTVPSTITDASNNAFAGATYTYTVGDNTAPTASVVPASGATNLTQVFDVDVTFDEAVTVPTGAISVSSNATAVVTAPVSGNTYRVKITAPDMAVVTLSVSSAVKDLSVNANAFVAKTYTYTVGDNTAPVVIDGGYSPADGDMGIKGAVSLKLTFNENVVAGSSTAKVKVYEQLVSSSNALVYETAITSGMILGKVVTIPLTGLKDNTAYTVTVDNGIVKDASVNANVFATGFTDPTRWNFQVGDNVKPSLVSKTPVTGTTTVDAHPSFKLTFDENVAAGVGSVKIYKVGTTTVTLTIPVTAAMINGKDVNVSYIATTGGGLDKNTSYYILVDAGAITDLGGNSYDGITSITDWTFKTGANFPTGEKPIVGSSNEFKVYPNPFVDVVTIKSSVDLSKVVISNLAGQAVKEFVNPDGSIELGELRSGIYFISMYNMDNVIVNTAKIVKK